MTDSEELSPIVVEVDRNSFPPGFIFGAGSSSYQTEGAVHEGGRGTTVWDTNSHTPGVTANGDTGDVACDSYHRYMEDISLLSKSGFDAYRFSIAWSRIYTDGVGTINQEGVDYYNRVIDAVIEHRKEPWVTLYHWDLPQALEDSFGGWTSPEIVPVFENYVRTCFTLFGDRVRHWTTVNEPTQFLMKNVPVVYKAANDNGDPAEDMFLAGHHVILAHAAAVNIYRTEFQASQQGIIGIVMDIQWYEALTDSDEDKRTQAVATAWRDGWFLNPVVYGDYAENFKDCVGSILPTFTAEESEFIKQSFDYVGINHYTSSYVTSTPGVPGFAKDPHSFPDAAEVYLGQVRNGVQIGPETGAVWERVVPAGMKKVVDYISRTYGNPVLYITENGYGERTDSSVPLDTRLQDTLRIQYHYSYLSSLLDAIRDGAQVRGYFMWSLLDSFEWVAGYTVGFGLVAVDRENMDRHPKLSTQWWHGFLNGDFAQFQNVSKQEQE